MDLLPRLLTCAVLVGALAACGGSADPADPIGGGPTSEQPADAPTSSPDQSGDTSTPAEDVTPNGELTRAEAEAAGTAYLGLSESEAEQQAQVDQREFRVGARDGEDFMLTEDYVIGRITVSIEGGEVVAATVESSDGPVTVEQ